MIPSNPLDQWTLVIGFLMPLLVSVITQTHWPKAFKTIISFAACIAASCIELGVKGQLTDFASVATNSLAISALAVTFYSRFWSELGITGAIEKATSKK